MLGWLLLWGCGKEPEGDTGTEPEPDPPGACGDISSFDATITGLVQDASGNAVGGALVELEERTWTPGTIHGSATAASDGTFVLAATGLPVVEDCWGTAVSFWLLGSSGDLSGEKPMNSLLFDAWADGTGQTDLGSFPLTLE
jgi:hypothetical protein